MGDPRRKGARSQRPVKDNPPLSKRENQMLRIVSVKKANFSNRQDIHSAATQSLSHRSRHMFIHVEPDVLSHQVSLVTLKVRVLAVRR